MALRIRGEQDHLLFALGHDLDAGERAGDRELRLGRVRSSHARVVVLILDLARRRHAGTVYTARHGGQLAPPSASLARGAAGPGPCLGRRAVVCARHGVHVLLLLLVGFGPALSTRIPSRAAISDPSAAAAALGPALRSQQHAPPLARNKVDEASAGATPPLPLYQEPVDAALEPEFVRGEGAETEVEEPVTVSLAEGVG